MGGRGPAIFPFTILHRLRDVELRMKRALFIGAGAPWTGGAGYLVRQASLLRALARSARLHLALFDFPVDAPAAPFPCDITPLALIRRPSAGKLSAALADLADPLPRLARNINLEKTRAPLAGIDPASFDAIVAYRIDFAFSAGVIGGNLRHPCLVLDVDDPEHLRWHRRMEAEGIRRDWRTLRDLEKLRRFEQQAVASAAKAFVCQEQDRRAFPGKNVIVVPNGVHLPPPRRRPVTQPVVLFLGNFAAGPGSANGDALVWFIADVWPRVLQETPAAECRIVGKISSDLRARIAGAPGVRVVGFVESLETAFAEARVSVAPVRFGTGTRIKILDAWAHGCPVVSTSAGAEGLGAKSGDNLLLADDAAAFAARCVELLRDPLRAAQIGAAGRRTVAAAYDAAKIEERLAAFFRDLLAGAPAPALTLTPASAPPPDPAAPRD
jgi:glycosyltransferase involved in cell wall biosynthesis